MLKLQKTNNQTHPKKIENCSNLTFIKIMIKAKRINNLKKIIRSQQLYKLMIQNSKHNLRLHL
jgi:hypothetical protein